MQTTANYGLKKPEGNDTVDIDVINGNMDSIDGELSKRAPGGYGLGTMAVDISNQDLNNYNTTGFFRGSSMTNAPNSDWYYVEVVGHDGNWTLQVATNYFNNNMYYRRRNDGTWQGWVRIANTSDIPSSLPASGGNSATVGGFSASGTPSTTEKSNLVGMINELFQSGTNGKNYIYNAISAKGTIPASKNFSDLVNAIGNISTGRRHATGTGTTTTQGYAKVSNLIFTPSLVIIVKDTIRYTGDYLLFLLFLKDYKLSSPNQIYGVTYYPSGNTITIPYTQGTIITSNGFDTSNISLSLGDSEISFNYEAYE